MNLLKSDRLADSSVSLCRNGIRMWECARFSCFAIVLLLLAVVVLGAQPELAHAQTTATYTVTFKGNWNTQSTPDGVAGGAHFTTLIGAVHNSNVTFWAAGGTATSGVERVAELGSIGTFKSEINAKGTDVKSTVEENGTGATGTRTFEVEFSRTHPLLTLLSMIGPSPDWFVGVSGLSMLDSSNSWRSSRTVDLFAYDAGTEDGESFSLTNPATNPQGTITSLRNQGKFSDVRMARLTFTLKQQMNTNSAPEFSGTSAARSFAETVGAARVQNAGNVGAVLMATDDDNDTLTYSLEGTDRNRFTIVSGSGQIRTKVGESYDREAKASYLVTVKADDQNGGTDTIAVTINVTDEEEKPLAPAAPSVSSAGTASLNVRWSAPNNAGRPGITGYKVQYRQGTSGVWKDVLPMDISGTSATIPVSDSSAQHQARVLAINSDGDGPWSGAGSNVVASPLPTLPPIMEAEEVDTDDELREFVEDAVERIEASDAFEETLNLLEEFRDSEGGWNNGSMYLVLLTKRGGVYFHANDREAEDLNWSGVVFCETGEDVLDVEEGCFIDGGGYAHPFSASHVPLAHGEDEFILLGGFEEIPEGKPFTGVIDGPSTEAGDVDTDDELKGFVGDAARALGEALSNQIDPAQLRGILRTEGAWREGDVYVYVMDETGRVIFDGQDRSREQKRTDEPGKLYVIDRIANAGEEAVGHVVGDFWIYAVKVEIPLDGGGEESRIYVVGSEYRVEETPPGGNGNSGGGGGCAVGGSDSTSAFGLILAALTLLLAKSFDTRRKEERVR